MFGNPQFQVQLANSFLPRVIKKSLVDGDALAFESSICVEIIFVSFSLYWGDFSISDMFVIVF